MNRVESASLLLCLCVPFLVGSTDEQRRLVPERRADLPGVSVRLRSLQITNTAIELHCDVRNDSGQDIWVYSRGPADHFPRGPRMRGLHGVAVLDVNDYGNATAFMDKDGTTFLTVRRMNPPCYGVVRTMIPWVASYRRLPTGDSQTQVLSLALPVKGNPLSIPQGFLEAKGRGILTTTRLAFEIGYYTTPRLQSCKGLRVGHAQMVSFNEAGDEVTIRDLSESTFWGHECAVRMAVDGLSIPLSEWVDFERLRRSI